MNNITELNTTPFTKKQKVFLDKEFKFTEDNKGDIHIKANEYARNKAILERDRKYHLQITDYSFKVNYKNRKAEMLN